MKSSITDIKNELDILEKTITDGNIGEEAIVRYSSALAYYKLLGGKEDTNDRAFTKVLKYLPATECTLLLNQDIRLYTEAARILIMRAMAKINYGNKCAMKFVEMASQHYPELAAEVEFSMYAEAMESGINQNIYISNMTDYLLSKAVAINYLQVINPSIMCVIHEYIREHLAI